jgi:predicted amidohydrolase
MKECNTVMIQPFLIWENIEANLDMLNNLIVHVAEETDLIILPETFSTGFTMQADLHAEELNGRAVSWMQKVAAEKQAYVAGSVIIRKESQIFNRLLWISPEGIEGTYDKRHLFRMGRENEHFVAGSSREIFQLGSFRFLPQICYDLRFPVFSRNRNDYDVLFYVANWPATRQQVWETLLKARAIENQAYVLGVNRVGTDGVGVDHVGGTTAIDPMGNVIKKLDPVPGILRCKLELEKVREFRDRFPAWKDADPFTLE